MTTHSSHSGTSFHRPILGLVLGLMLYAALPVSAPLALASVKAMLPDFYSEPGLSPFRDGVSANVNEVVDTFSGALHLS